MIVKGIVYFAVIDEATCGEWLEEAANWSSMVVDLELLVDFEVTVDLFLVEYQETPIPVIHIGESKYIALLVLLDMWSLQINALNRILIYFGKGFKVVEHDQESEIILVDYGDRVLRFTVDDTRDNRQVIAVDQELVSKILKHRLILSELLVDLSLLFDRANGSLKTPLFLFLVLGEFI